MVQLKSFKGGIYDILRFTNGRDTLLATERISAKHISQFRFILGDDNTVVVDGITYPLKAPSGQQSGFKVNVDETLTDGVKDNNTVASSRPDKETGAFTINGLTPGHYKVLIDDSNGYKDKKFEDVEV